MSSHARRPSQLSPPPALSRISPRQPHRSLCSTTVKRRHDILGEPPELFFEFLGGQSLGPVDHEILQARILRLNRFDPLDDLRRRPPEPSVLLNAIPQVRHPPRHPRRTQTRPSFLAVAAKANRPEPFCA